MKENKFFDASNKKKLVSIFGLSLVLVMLMFVIPSIQTDTAWGQGKDEDQQEEQKGGGEEEGKGDEGPEDQNIELCGFAWGATSEGARMGAGWVSFNSRDCDVNGDGILGNEGVLAVPGCPTSGTTADYGVVLNSSNQMEGYAWSSNLGWLKFGGLSGMPTTAGNSLQQAVVLGNNQVHGWARFCAGTTTGTCSVMTARPDGWDGWISLRGTNYGVNYNPAGQKFSGFSWGGPVVGWLNWDAGTGNGVRYCTTQTLTATLSANPNSGQEPLTGVDLSVNILGSATGNSTIRFDCNNDGTYDITRSNISGNQYTEVDACNYSSAGNYNAKVEVTRGGLTSTATAPIFVTSPNVPPGPPVGEIGVSCSVSTPVYVNQASTWTVNITPNDATSPYTYNFDFSDNQPDPLPVVTEDESVQVDRIFSTVGRKTLEVTIEDSQDVPATGFCSVDVNVIVRPIIKEI